MFILSLSFTLPHIVLKPQLHTMKALQIHLFISLYSTHYTEMFQWHCYNNGSDRFSCSDCKTSNDFIVCDCGLTVAVAIHLIIAISFSPAPCFTLVCLNLTGFLTWIRACRPIAKAQKKRFNSYSHLKTSHLQSLLGSVNLFYH